MKARYFISIGLQKFIMEIVVGTIFVNQRDLIPMTICQNFLQMYCVEPVPCKILMMP